MGVLPAILFLLFLLRTPASIVQQGLTQWEYKT